MQIGKVKANFEALMLSHKYSHKPVKTLRYILMIVQYLREPDIHKGSLARHTQGRASQTYTRAR